MTKNYIFREFECGLSVEETAKLCFKTARTVKEWDRGKPIPPECKRLMRMYKRLELSTDDNWDGFKVMSGRLVLPNGDKVSPQQIVLGMALVEIQSILEIKTTSKIVKYARILARIKK